MSTVTHPTPSSATRASNRNAPTTGNIGCVERAAVVVTALFLALAYQVAVTVMKFLDRADQ